MGEKVAYIKRIAVYLWHGLLEIIYPRESYCIICGNDGCDGICTSCMRSIKSLEYVYKDNGEPVINSYGHYGGVLKKLILNFKYHKDFTAGDILCELIEKYIRENIQYEDYSVAYIPLSKKSQKNRGFNQCEYIARKVAYDLSINKIDILFKRKENREQKKLQRQDRFENVKDIFGVNEKRLREIKKIILIDDVTTTGATMLEAEKILKKYGVNEIKLLTLAKSHI